MTAIPQAFALSVIAFKPPSLSINSQFRSTLRPRIALSRTPRQRATFQVASPVFCSLEPEEAQFKEAEVLLNANKKEMADFMSEMDKIQEEKDNLDAMLSAQLEKILGVSIDQLVQPRHDPKELQKLVEQADAMLGDSGKEKGVRFLAKDGVIVSMEDISDQDVSA